MGHKPSGSIGAFNVVNCERSFAQLVHNLSNMLQRLCGAPLLVDDLAIQHHNLAVGIGASGKAALVPMKRLIDTRGRAPGHRTKVEPRIKHRVDCLDGSL